MKRLGLIGLLVMITSFAGAPTGGVTTCPASGVKQLMTSAVKTASFTIQAPLGNQGTITIGNSSVATTGSIQLTAGLSYTPPSKGNSAAYDLRGTYFTCTSSSDALNWIYW